MDSLLRQAFGDVDVPAAKARYADQGGFIHLQGVLPAEAVQALVDDLEGVRRGIRRGHLPGIRKGGSLISRQLVRSTAIVSVYRSKALRSLLRQLTGLELSPKPLNDDHGFAVYSYAKAGDGMAMHYDDCNCEADASHTLLIGLINDTDARLRCELHTKDDRAEETLDVATAPGSVTFFCGSKVRHGVTPLGAGEERVVLSISYATRLITNPVRRFRENLKDAFIYVRPGSAFQRNYGARGLETDL